MAISAQAVLRTALGICVGFGLLLSSAWAREWSDSSGKFKIEGELKRFKEATVILEGEGGKEIKIPLAKLSEADQAFVKEQLAAYRAKYPDAPKEGTPDEIVFDAAPTAKVLSPIKVKDDSQDGIVRTVDLGQVLTQCAMFSPDGKSLFVGIHEGIFVVNLANGKILSKFPMSNFYGDKDRSNWSNDGKKFAMRGHDGHAYVFDVQPSGAFDNFQSLDLFESSRLDAVNICLGGKFLLALEDSKPVLVNLEKEDFPKIKIPMNEKIYSCHDVWISPDGNRAIMTSTSEAFHLDLRTKQVKVVKLPILFSKGAFSPDGKVVTSGTTEEIRLISTMNGKILKQIPTYGIGVKMSFSPTGKHLVVASKSEVTVYDTATGKQVGIQKFPPMSPLSVDVSPDNRLVALAWRGEKVDVNNLYHPVLILRFPCLGE